MSEEAQGDKETERNLKTSQSADSDVVRFFSNVSVRLQMAAIILSLIGIGYGVKSYLHVREVFGDAASQSFLIDLYYQVAIAIMVNIIVAIIIHITAVKPINILNETMRDLADGKLDVEIPYTDTPNQIGSTARKVLLFYNNVKNLQDLKEEQERNRESAERERKSLLEKLATNFDSTVNQIVSVVSSSSSDMQEASRSVVSLMDGNNKHVEELGVESSNATRNVSNIASSSEELSASISEINNQVGRASDMAKDAVKIAEDAGQTVGGLSDGAEKIGTIIDLINDIAEQINLLALNATIEAARAGEAGKGFAVVASEVKGLANQTAKATQEIFSYVNSIQQETNSAISFIKNISKTINEINDITVSISSGMEQQGLATRNIAKNMLQAVNHANKVEENVTKVSEVSKQTGSAAHEMLDICLELSQQSEKLNQEVEKFINTVKVA